MPGNSSCFIIAEIGVNHNGSIKLAEELIEVAEKAGANAVKFQTFDTSKLARPDADKAEYQKQQTGKGNQADMLEKLQLSKNDHRHLTEKCAAHGIEFMSTPFDPESASFLKSVGIKRLKLPSGDINNVPLIRRFASLDLPVIMSTGMADLAEVQFAKTCIEEEWRRLGIDRNSGDSLIILHCTSNYPALPEDVNLSAMSTMARQFDCPVGYSDHTAGTSIAIAAVALGASVIEKHITLNKRMPGPDHSASLEPDELNDMVAQIRQVEAALGDGIKSPRPSELAVRSVVRRSISSARNIAVGNTLSEDDLVMLRPSGGIPPTEFDKVVGRKARTSINAGALLKWEDLI